MATSNVWEITLRAELGGQECLNVFYYRGNALTNPEASDIAQSFEEQIFPDIDALASNDLFWVGISVRDIMSDISPHFRPLGVEGGGGPASLLPQHDAYGFHGAVEQTTTRPGAKRFAGVPEGAQEDGVITDAATIGFLEDLALTLAFSLFDHTTGLIGWAAPVIVKRILEDETYRLPEVIGELVTNAIVSWSPRLLVSTQNTRKQRST